MLITNCIVFFLQMPLASEKKRIYYIEDCFHHINNTKWFTFILFFMFVTIIFVTIAFVVPIAFVCTHTGTRTLSLKVRSLARYPLRYMGIYSPQLELNQRPKDINIKLQSSALPLSYEKGSHLAPV